MRNAANADFVTNSFATRWRLRRILRPSATIAGTTAKSPRTSTRSATLRAICVPVPCAIASRAAFSAGHVVDAVADHRDVAARRRAAPRRRAACPRARCARSRCARAASRAQLGRVVRAARGRRRPRPVGCRRRAAIAATVSGRSPESTFSSTPCALEELDRLARLGPQRSARTTRPRARARRRAGPGRARLARGRRRRATPPSRRAASLGARARAPPSGKQLGRAEDVARRRRAAVPLQRRREENGTSSLERARLGRDTRSAIASSVALRTPRARRVAAERVRERPRRRRRATSSATRSRASVSVPVLSRQTTSTEASDSIAFSCCASAPRRAMRTAATAKVRLASRISPSGTSVTTAATAVGTASWSGACRVPERVAEHERRAGPSRRRARTAAG